MPSNASATEPSQTTQAPPATVAVLLSRARTELSVAQVRLNAVEQNADGLKSAIQIWTDRISILENMMRPNLWADAVEAQLHVPVPTGAADSGGVPGRVGVPGWYAEHLVVRPSKDSTA